MTTDTEAGLVDALLAGTALPRCSRASQIVLGLALACYLTDHRLGSPLDRFPGYLATYADAQAAEAAVLGLATLTGR